MGCFQEKTKEMKLAEAENKFKHIIEESPDNIDAKYNLAITWYNQGKYEEASNYLKELNALYNPAAHNDESDIGGGDNASNQEPVNQQINEAGHEIEEDKQRGNNTINENNSSANESLDGSSKKKKEAIGVIKENEINLNKSQVSKKSDPNGVNRDNTNKKIENSSQDRL